MTTNKPQLCAPCNAMYKTPTPEQQAAVAEACKNICTPEYEKTMRLESHTCGAFRGAFYTLHGRLPTLQETFDQGVREGMRRQKEVSGV